MKNIMMIVSFIAMLGFVSCSSDQVKDTVNDLKLKTADKIAVSVEKVLAEEYAKADYAGLECEEEAIKTKEKVYAYAISILKAEEPKAEGFVVGNSSAGNMVCNVVTTQILPMLIEDADSSRRCLKKLGSVRIQELGPKICDQLL